MLQQEHHANPSASDASTPSAIARRKLSTRRLYRSRRLANRLCTTRQTLHAADTWPSWLNATPGRLRWTAARDARPARAAAPQLLLQAGEGVAAADRQALICATSCASARLVPALISSSAALRPPASPAGLDRSKMQAGSSGFGLPGAVPGAVPGAGRGGGSGEGKGSDRQGAQLHESLEIAPQELADGAMRSVGDVEGPGLVALRLPPQVAQTRRQHAAKQSEPGDNTCRGRRGGGAAVSAARTIGPRGPLGPLDGVWAAAPPVNQSRTSTQPQPHETPPMYEYELSRAIGLDSAGRPCGSGSSDSRAACLAVDGKARAPVCVIVRLCFSSSWPSETTQRPSTSS